VATDATGVPSVTITYVISNGFRLSSRPAANHAGTIRLPIDVPDAGRLTALATAKAPENQDGAKRTYAIIYGVDNVSTPGPRTVTIKITPSKAAKRLLSEDARLTVAIGITFTPTGGTVSSKAIRVEVNAKPKPRHG
jgi:hypothetical protein